ncbi:MAG TPA: response regulator [Vicinamibacterales bacterium]|nr:response regulator [Vicinamibacterales bacterium]
MTRILIVEDNQTNLALMEYLLRAFGYEVLTAHDGEHGIAMAARDLPDLILMDLQLPGISGFESAARIREASSATQVPIIAVTAFAMVGDRERVLAEGFDGYISKPITPETFVSEIEAYLPPGRRAVRGDPRP